MQQINRLWLNKLPKMPWKRNSSGKRSWKVQKQATRLISQKWIALSRTMGRLNKRLPPMKPKRRMLILPLKHNMPDKLSQQRNKKKSYKQPLIMQNLP